MLYQLLILDCIRHPPSLLRFHDLPHYWIAMFDLRSRYETSNEFLLLNRRRSYDVGPITVYSYVSELVSCIILPVSLEDFEFLVDLIDFDCLLGHEDVVF